MSGRPSWARVALLTATAAAAACNGSPGAPQSSTRESYFADLANAGLPNNGYTAGGGAQPMVPGAMTMAMQDASTPQGPAAGGSSEPKPGMALPMNGSTRAQLVDRGRYLVHHVAACTECHTPRDVVGRLDPTRLLSGVDCFRDGSPNRDKSGCLHTGNLTHHETGLKNRSDAEIKAMFLEGRRPDGRALHPTMPYWVFGNMEAADADAIVAYLRAVPGIQHMIPRNQPPFADVAAPAARWPAASLPTPLPAYPDQAAAARGRYLAATLGSCIECHTPRAADGTVDTTRAFRGGLIYQRAELGLPAGIFPDAIATANLTPHADGLAGWTVEDVVRALKLGRDRDGKTLCPPMPGGMGAFGGLTDQDARDIGHYLLSLPPAEGKVADECAAPF
jgi:mono/diheme cytochrome c family protein